MFLEECPYILPWQKEKVSSAIDCCRYLYMNVVTIIIILSIMIVFDKFAFSIFATEILKYWHLRSI